MATGSGNQSSSSFVARAEPYPNTRYKSRGDASLNNRNSEFAGYESATNKKALRNQKKQKTSSPPKETPAENVVVDNSIMDIDNDTSITEHSPDPLESAL